VLVGSQQARERARRVLLGLATRPRSWLRRSYGIVIRIPRAGRICFGIALVNAAVWGVVVPPFQVPDEISHFSYVQYLAETGAPPPGGRRPPYSSQEIAALKDLYFYSVIGHAQMRGVFTSAEDRALHVALAKHPSPLGHGGASSSSNQPPLYYALEAIPYWLSPSHDILARLALMRLLSALMAACTVLVVFEFLRELLPHSPTAWTVGALVVAFQPMFNFVAAGVQGDNLLYLTSALTFLMLLRAYRRGFTTRRAAAVGAVVATGLLTKLTFIGLLPGIALAVALLAWRARSDGSRTAVRALAVAASVAIIPVVIYATLNAVAWHRGGPTAGGVSGATDSVLSNGVAVTLGERLEYIWQLYLPPLWFMRSYFSHYPLWSTWLNGSIGRFGWVDYGFPKWVYTAGRYVFYLLLVLALAGTVRLRAAIRPIVPMLLCFAAMGLGLLFAIGYAGIDYRFTTGLPFEQARYLFPLLVFYGAFAALAMRGAGRRWAPLVGGALVVLAMAHGLFAETLTISRYYG
jgi:4-amino-4-deoxy-L-arabinose transferase-like glycosyltransferase